MSMRDLTGRLHRLELGTRAVMPARCAACGGPSAVPIDCPLYDCATLEDLENPALRYVSCRQCGMVVRGRVVRGDDGARMLVGAVPSVIPYL